MAPLLVGVSRHFTLYVSVVVVIGVQRPRSVELANVVWLAYMVGRVLSVDKISWTLLILRFVGLSLG